jgi:PAS domain S-box-containing protein
MNPFDLLPTPVLVTGPMGRISFINQSLLALVGLEASHLLGGSMDKLFPPASRILLQTHIWPNLVSQGMVQEVYLSMLGGDGISIPILVNCHRQCVDGSDSFFWVFSVILARSRFEQEMLTRRQDADEKSLVLDAKLHTSSKAQEALSARIGAHELSSSILLQSQLTLSQATRIAKLGVWRNDMPDIELCVSNATSWSAEMYALLGYIDANSTAPSISAYLARVHADDRPRLLDAARQALLERRAWQTEYRLVRGDGTESLVEETGEFVFDLDGQVITMLGVVKDITAQKKIELSLALHRDTLEELVRARTFALSESEQETKKFNRSLRMLSRCNMAIVHAKDEHLLLNELCQHICENGDFLMAWFGLMAQGSESQMVPVAQFGYPSGYLKIIQTRWAIEQEMGTGPICAAITTAKTQVSQNLWQEPFDLLWQKAGQLHDPHAFIALPLWVGDQLLGVLAIHSQHINAFSPPEVVLLEELTRNIAFGLKTLRARKELDRYQLRLEDLVATRTAELSEAKNIADAANLAKGLFLATISHELRTPLNAIIGLGGLLEGSNLTQRQRDYTNKIQLSGKTLCALIDDVLDFSKIESGELDLVVGAFSLRDILHSTIELITINLGDKPIESLIDAAATLPDALLGDALRLQQVLLNLCSNAIKFTVTGEIILSVHCLLITDADVTLKFAVKDTGIGIAPDKQVSIFDEFTQADSTISRNFGGTGLGLAISSRLVRLMGAELLVNSTLGEGSEFSFTVKFPLGQNTPAPLENELPKGLRVLIVDDHPLALALQTQNCQAFGWQPKSASSAAAGLLELQRSVEDGLSYDVLLLDWRMPDMDGLEMLHLAHNTPGLILPLVILMVPAFELEQAALAGADLALDGLVAKPFGPDGLWLAVTRAYAGEYTEILPTLGKPDRPLSGMRLLVAEDNALNQEVIEQVLTQAGATVVLASNGLAAVEALRKRDTRFDAVLMDIQMPVMDGYNATRLIRDELGLLNLPIIAVTAHARPEDRERSRLAGMVGHLVKPLNVKDLLALVSRVRSSQVGDFFVNEEPLLQIVSPACEWLAIDIAGATAMLGGDEAKCLEMLTKFSDQHGDDVKTVRQLLACGDEQGAISIFHSLCGIAGLLQAKTLAHACANCEEALHTAQADVMPDLLDAMDHAMQDVQSEIEAFKLRAFN